MQNFGAFVSHYGVDNHGIKNPGTVYWNLTTAMLYEHVTRKDEGKIAHLGPLVVQTGGHTGRSPNDRFVVKEPESESKIWWGKVNRPFSQENFDYLYRKMLAYVQNRDIYVFDGYVGADPTYRMPVRIITEYAWHNLFARNMFIREFDPEKLRNHVPQFTVIDMPRLKAEPDLDGTNSQTFILVDFGRRLVLIGGTEYAGEIKKSIFTAMNYFMPQQGVMSMHCSANFGKDRDDVALFFGLSGTGKTTLSSDPSRTLIGDDEHGWSDDGVFNYEGGCYAKVIRLDPKGEPEIYETTRKFGTILENVILDNSTRRVDLNDGSLTENTRSSYPISHVSNAVRDGMGGHPNNVFFLTADAFGVLPPIARLTNEQAMYHFLSGYTAKVAGTERGVTEPQPNFSTCFGAPFMPLRPGIYAELLGDKIQKHGAKVWLVNTGWTGGPYGVGSRMKLAYTRRMITAALNGELDDVPMVEEPFFGLSIPQAIQGVPSEVLNPRNTWSDKDAYDAQAQRLVGMFKENFKQFEENVSNEIKAAGPR
ncbi:MAG TPA: phosphoenolpyruvate carboxykinase [Promineifilum sp.]|nr:phosphoenolpyruvate carboxykinase [Promineifilum sp.]HRO89135.1 phosphoenolpyruvate carboxykinase [Promineifilum sp.]HRQ12498.1 phosphoenolpyruvate carboxykinase [Promineifilum sp.]